VTYVCQPPSWTRSSSHPNITTRLDSTLNPTVQLVPFAKDLSKFPLQGASIFLSSTLPNGHSRIIHIFAGNGQSTIKKYRSRKSTINYLQLIGILLDDLQLRGCFVDFVTI
jgi:hypothetical protein